MRRFVFSLLAFALVLTTGCKHVCMHGVCDCEIDDHCCSRQPWVNAAAVPLPPVLGAPIEAPPRAMPPADTRALPPAAEAGKAL